MGVRLPAEYQQVEYIEATGSQYIDTLIAPFKTQADITYQYVSWVSNVDSVICASYSSNNRYYPVAKNNLGKFNICDRNNTILYRRDMDADKHRVIFNTPENTVLYDGAVVATSALMDLTTQGRTLSLFARHSGNTEYAGLASAKIYRATFMDKTTGNLVGDFVPCYRKADDKPGMFDDVSKTFFVNSGTGEFLVGDDVIDYSSKGLLIRRRGLVAQSSRIWNPPAGAIFWHGVDCEDVQNGFNYYYKTGSGSSSAISISVVDGTLMIYKPTSVNFDCDPVGSFNLSGKHTVRVVCKASRPLTVGDDQVLFGIARGTSRVIRVAEKDITSGISEDYSSFSVDFQSDETGWPLIRLTGSGGKDPYTVIVKEWVIS